MKDVQATEMVLKDEKCNYSHIKDVQGEDQSESCCTLIRLKNHC